MDQQRRSGSNSWEFRQVGESRSERSTSISQAKEALLYALVGRHLDKASDAVERACQAHRTMPVATCSDAFVNAYIDAKTGNPASYRARCTMPRPSSS